MMHNHHQRRSVRLPGFNYGSIGKYFITICSHRKTHLFGVILHGEMQLNELGLAVQRCWQALPSHFPHVELDQFVIMPNHIHGIISIVSTHIEAEKAKDISPLRKQLAVRGTSKTLGSIVRGFKAGVTKWARQNMDICMVWQRNYYDHIIRNDADYLRLAEYIITNPQRWRSDRFYNESYT